MSRPICRQSGRSIGVALAIATGLLSSQAMAFDKGGSRVIADTEGTGRNDIVCGPRCLQYLLGYYGARSDSTLIDIIRDVQSLDEESGSSLLDLRDYLERHGIQARPLQISQECTLSWKYPSIV